MIARTITVLSMLAASCSFTVRTAPDPPPPGEPVRCTSSLVRPGFDLAAAASATLLGAAMVYGYETEPREDDASPDLGLGVALIAFAIAAPYAIAAAYGFDQTGRCRHLQSLARSP